MSLLASRRFRLTAMVLVTLVVAVALAYPKLRERFRDYVRARTPLPAPERTMALKLGPATATDWPQWRGQKRDGHSLETGLLKDWPEGGPKLLWTFDGAGTGYSAPCVVGGVVFIPGARAGAEYVVALDARTGEPLGEAVIGHEYENPQGGGPRATPTYDADKLYALGGFGDLACIDPATGQAVWRKNIYGDLDGTQPGWGCGESPLVDGELVICTPGGAKGTVIALNKHTGDVVWRSTGFTDEPGYSSVVVAEPGATRQYIQMTFASVAGFAAKDGKLLWRYPRHGPNAPVPTPLVRDRLVYATSGYGAGCHLVRLSKDGADLEDEGYVSKVMSNHHGGVVLVGDYVYGYSDNKGWICQDFLTGKMIWSTPRNGPAKGCITTADGLLYCYTEDDGTCYLAEASPAGWKEHGKLTIPRHTSRPRGEGKIWAHPVIADGKLFLRDQELLFCYDIKGP